MISELKELLEKMAQLIEKKIPEARLSNDADGRPWALKELDYSDELKTTALQKITDRSGLNSEYVSRYDEKEQPAKKGISALKIEVSALYSFTKCFVQRYKGRMHFYRDDLSQKGARSMCSVGFVAGKFENFKEGMDE